LQEFPPTSKLDPAIYGNQNSTITTAHIENNLEEVQTVEQVRQIVELIKLEEA